jgi:hypothetical protein
LKVSSDLLNQRPLICVLVFIYENAKLLITSCGDDFTRHFHPICTYLDVLTAVACKKCQNMAMAMTNLMTMAWPYRLCLFRDNWDCTGTPPHMEYQWFEQGTGSGGWEKRLQPLLSQCGTLDRGVRVTHGRPKCPSCRLTWPKASLVE